MRRLPKSWNRTMVSLGLRRNKSRNLKRNRNSNSSILRGERLEDRRVLAAWFERTDDLDQWATAHPNVDINLEMVTSADFDSDELLAFSGAIAQIDRDAGFAQEELAFLGRANVRRDDEVFIPTVQAASQQALLLDINEPVYGRAGVYGGTAVGNGVFELFEDDPVVNEFTFHGTLFLAAYGADQASGDVESRQSMFVRASIGELFVQSTPNGDGTWNFTTNLPGYADDPEAGAPNGAYVFTIDNLTQGAVLSFESQVNSWNMLENDTNGTGSGQSQWELVAAAWGSVTPEGQGPLNGDFDGDGDVDADDLAIWNQNSGAGPGGDNGPNFGTLSQGDADEDGDVDEDDLAIWASGAANSPTGKIFLVSSEGDSVDADRTYGNLTLREALAMSDASAGDDDVIMFGPGVDQITLGSALSIADEVSIVGPGADKLTVSGNNASRVFTVSSGVAASISDMTITEGNVSGANYGGAIHNAGDLTLNSVVVSDNHSAVYGGAIYSIAGAKLHIEDSTFTINSAGSTGGAIYTDSILVGALVIERSTFFDNQANTAGAIYLNGNDGEIGTATISNSTFSGNLALVGGGGAISNGGGAPPLTIINSTIAYNTAGNGGGGISMHNNSDNRFVLHNTILAHNSATSAANANLNRAVKSTSSYNVIGYGGTSGLTDGVAGNILLGSGISAGLAPLGDYGGKTKTHALLIGSPALNVGSDSLAPAIDQRGEGRPDTSPSSSDIGAYEAGLGTTLTVRSDGDRNDSIALAATVASLRLREALMLSAALAGRETIVFDQTGWGDGEIALSLGQLSTTQDVIIEGPGADQLTVNAQLASRVFNVGAAAEFRGLTIKGGSTTGSGGGVYSNGHTVTIDACTFESNYAATGGGLYFRDGELALSNSTFYNNHASSNGAGIYLRDTDKAVITNTTISGNIAVGSGGGIYNTDSSSPKIINSTIAYNQAATGGGIYNATAGVLVSNTIVAENTASTSSDMHGTFSNSSKNNLIGADSVSLVGIDNGEDDNIVGLGNARLAPLDYYGGRTKVHSLYSDSGAIDKGNNGVATLFGLDEDQRGFARAADFYDDDLTEYVDIGAVELAFDGLYF